MKNPPELFVVERENGEWISAIDGADYSVFTNRGEAQDALDTEADSCDDPNELFKIVRFVRET